MNHLLRWIPCAALALLAGCASTRPLAQPEAAAPAPVLLVSIDGFRADYLDRGISPTLSALARDGVRAQPVTHRAPPGRPPRRGARPAAA